MPLKIPAPSDRQGILGQIKAKKEPLAGRTPHGIHCPGFFALALLMAYLYPKGYSEGSPVGEGLKFGILIGLIWILPLGLILDAVWHLVEEGAGGIVIGLVYGRNTRAQ